MQRIMLGLVAAASVLCTTPVAAQENAPPLLDTVVIRPPSSAYADIDEACADVRAAQPATKKTERIVMARFSTAISLAAATGNTSEVLRQVNLMVETFRIIQDYHDANDAWLDTICPSS